MVASIGSIGIVDSKSPVMECSDSMQHAVHIKKRLQVPTVGTHSGKWITQETMILVGPMRLEESSQIRNNRINTFVIVSRIHSRSKKGN